MTLVVAAFAAIPAGAATGNDSLSECIAVNLPGSWTSACGAAYKDAAISAENSKNYTAALNSEARQTIRFIFANFDFLTGAGSFEMPQEGIGLTPINAVIIGNTLISAGTLIG